MAGHKLNIWNHPRWVDVMVWHVDNCHNMWHWWCSLTACTIFGIYSRMSLLIWTAPDFDSMGHRLCPNPAQNTCRNPIHSSNAISLTDRSDQWSTDRNRLVQKINTRYRTRPAPKNKNSRIKQSVDLWFRSPSIPTMVRNNLDPNLDFRQPQSPSNDS